MDLKFYKSPTKPSGIKEGSIWFDTTNKRITLIGGSSDTVFGSDIETASYESNILKIYKVGSTTPIQIDLSNLSKVTDIENTLAIKLNKIKVKGTEVNSTSLNLIGSGGTTIEASGSNITISSPTVPTTFDASAITSGTIDIARIPKAALERLYIVTTEAEALSNTEISEGDTVQVTNNSNHMYFCVDDSATTFATKFREYTAATTITVDWEDINNKPTKLSDFTDDLGAVSSISLYEANSTGAQISKATWDPYIGITTTYTNGNSNSSAGIQLYGSSNIDVYSRGNNRIIISGPVLSNYLTSSDLDGYAKTTDIPSLTGYATQDWVTNKGYVTSSGITSGSLALASSSTGTSNATSTATPYLNLVLNGSETGSVQIAGSSNVSVSGANGKLTISGPDLSGYATTGWVSSNFLTSAPVTSVNGKTGAVTLTIPTKVSELTNDANYLTSAPVTSVNGETGDVTLTIPDAYTLPKATSSTLGGIKVGTNLSINSSTGVLSATNTTYSAGTGLSLNGTTFNVGTNYSQNGKNYPVKASDGNLYVNVPWTDTAITVDSSLSSTSTNPVQNNVINTALAGKSDTDHTHTTSQIIDFPSSMPASDVYSWAKASTKPSYTASEVGALPDTTEIPSITDLLNGNTSLVAARSGTVTYKATSNASNPWISLVGSKGTASTVSTVLGSVQLVGSGDTTISAANNVITISSTSSSSYTLPTATSSTLGGVTIGDNITVSSGKISLTKSNVISALGYTPLQTSTITGVKGNAESSYRTGNVNITPANIGLTSETWTFEMEDGTTVSKTIYTA